ncbi:MAG TPA: CPBP family intramembrane glutamic endopeptidase [Candidatus Acidoferrales bacterium]|nr:CPBP family intramembrane glutamic endopeptidase [Candidatus Acidoferrales bacterium]
MPREFALILLFLASAVPLLGRHRTRQLMAMPQTTKANRLALYRSTVASQWVGAAFIFWRATAHRVPPSGLGLAIPQARLAVVAAMVLSALVLANQLLSLRRLAHEPTDAGSILLQLARKVFPQDHGERLAFLGVVLTVSLCEEFIFRGFSQHVLETALWGSALAGIFGSAILFALAHLYQGSRGVIATFVVGVLFASVRSYTGSLLAPIAAHFTADLTAGLFAPAHLGIGRSALRDGKNEL